MANLIYGINSNAGLSELQSKTKALETLGLKVDDLNKVGDTGEASTSLSQKINVNQFHHLSQGSGSPNQVFKENILDRIDRYAKASSGLTQRLENLAGPKITSVSGLNTDSIKGNIVVNGPIGAPSIRYFSTEQLNADTGIFEPLDISTSRVSSWNTSGEKLSFGGDLTIDNLSPANAGGNVQLNKLPMNEGLAGSDTPALHIGLIRIDGRTQQQPITSRAFAAETATHKLKVKINGEDIYLYAMKNIPLLFNGTFRGYGAQPSDGTEGIPLFLAKRASDVEGTTQATDYRIFLNGRLELEHRSSETTQADRLYFNNNVTRPRTIEVYQDPAKISDLKANTSGEGGLNLTNFPNATYSRLKTLSFSRCALSTLPNLTEITKDITSGVSEMTLVDFSGNRFYNSPTGSIPNLNRITNLSLGRLPSSLTTLRLGSAFGIGSNAVNKLSAVSETFKRRFLNLEELSLTFDNQNTLNSPILPEVSASVTSYQYHRNSFKVMPGTSVVQRFDLNNTQPVMPGSDDPTKPAKVKIRRALNFFKVELESPGVGYTASQDGLVIDTKVLTKTGAGSPEGIPFGELKLNTGTNGEVLSAHFKPYHNPHQWTQQRITERAKANGDVFTRLPHVKDSNYSPMGYYVDCGFLSSPVSISGYKFEHMDLTVFSKYDAFMNPFYDTGSGTVSGEFVPSNDSGSGSALKGSTYNPSHGHHNVYKNTADDRTMNTLNCDHSHLPVPFFVNYTGSGSILNINHTSVHPKRSSDLESSVNRVRNFIHGIEIPNTYNYNQLFTYYDSPQATLDDSSYGHARGTGGLYKLLNATRVQSIICVSSELGGTIPNFTGNSNLKTIRFSDTIFNRFQTSSNNTECHLPINQFKSCVGGIGEINITKAAAPVIGEKQAFGESSNDAGERTGRIAGYHTLPVERIGASYGFGTTSSNWTFALGYGGDVGTSNEIKDGDFSTDILGGSLTKFIVKLRNKVDDNPDSSSLAPFTLSTSDLDNTGIPKYGGLTGPIPTFKNATSLIDLDMSFNSLTGKLDEFTLSHNPVLETLNLENNRIRGKLDFNLLANGTGSATGLDNLTTLELQDNNIEEITNFGAATQQFTNLQEIKLENTFDCPSYRNGAMQVRLEPTSTIRPGNPSRWLLDRRIDGTSSNYEKSIPNLKITSTTSHFPSLTEMDISVNPKELMNGKFINFDSIDEDMFMGCPNIKEINLAGNGFDKLAIIDVLKAVKKLVTSNSRARRITINFDYQRGFDSPSDGTGMPGIGGKTDFRILQPTDNINSYSSNSVYRKGATLVAQGQLQESDLNYNNLDDLDLIDLLTRSPYNCSIDGVKAKRIEPLPNPNRTLYIDFFESQVNKLQATRKVTGSNTGNQTINIHNWNNSNIVGRLVIGGIDRTRTKKIEVSLIRYDGVEIPLPSFTMETTSGRLPSSRAYTFTLNLENPTDPIWKNNLNAPYILGNSLTSSDTNFGNHQQSFSIKTTCYGTRELMQGSAGKTRTRTYTFRNQVQTRTGPEEASHPEGEWKQLVFVEDEE